MKLRALTAASAAMIVTSLVGSGRASAADLGTFTLGDSISMAKACDQGDDFADLHIASGHHPAWSLGVDPQITDFDIDPSTTHYSYDTTAQGVGDFTVIIHCWAGDPHDPVSQEYIYTFTVAAVAVATTTAVIPATGAKGTTSITMMATFAVLAGASLLLVRRRRQLQ